MALKEWFAITVLVKTMSANHQPFEQVSGERGTPIQVEGYTRQNVHKVGPLWIVESLPLTNCLTPPPLPLLKLVLAIFGLGWKVFLIIGDPFAKKEEGIEGSWQLQLLAHLKPETPTPHPA